MTTLPMPRFTGIFIPVEVLERTDLSPLDQLLLSWIDALYSKEHKGCYAKNEYFAEKLRVKTNTIVKSLIKLRNLGLVEDVSFNGRIRVLRACIGKFVNKTQSQADCDLNHMQDVTKITGCMGEKSLTSTPPPIYERKEEIKDNKYIAQSAPPLRSSRTEIQFSFSEEKFQNITDKDVATWQELYPVINIQRELKEMVQWLLSHPTKAKSKKLWRKFILGWLQRQNEQKTNKLAYKDRKSEEMMSRHTGFRPDHTPRDPSKVIDLSQ